jgi:hypothetical protein
MSAVTVIRHIPPPIVGVCVPAPDHRFQALEAELDWLEVNGVIVNRIDPVTNAAGLEHVPEAARLWHTEGASALPLVVVDGHVESQGHFPSRHELAHLVATHQAAGSVDAVRHVASLAVAAALGAPDDVARERSAAGSAGVDEASLDAAEDAARHAVHATRR